jgi:hypothetical protein
MSHPESTLSRLALEAAAKGICTLAPAQAHTLRPRSSGVLTIARGAVWVTNLGPHEGTAEGGPQGDMVLPAGASLAVQAGSAWVIEPIGLHGQPAQLAAFDWHAADDTDRLAWKAAVARPASDLGHAMGDAAQAFTRLLRGVAMWLLTPRWPHRPSRET